MSIRVLVVDDSLTMRMDLRETLEGAGFETTLCENLAAARAALAQNAFALIVLDVQLPDGDGIDLLREIKIAPTGADVPVMLLSTEAEVADRVRGIQTGAAEYVGKPYDAAYVLAHARQMIHVRGDVGQTPSGPSLLLIDGSAGYREAFKSELEAAGYGVVCAETGEEGLRAAVTLRPSAVIVDSLLRGRMDGATVARRLKEDAALRNTSCLLLTAPEECASEVRALDAGADAYLHKDSGADVILARIAAALRHSNTPAPEETTASTLLGPKRILAVDDSPTYLHLVASELRKDGYDVVLARSGEEALALLAIQEVDCILLDLMMPGLSGEETCRRIKASPVWRDIPLLMVTAMEDRLAMIEGINAGADDYILKSSDFEVLRARLRAQLRRRQDEDDNRRIREELMQKGFEAAQARAAQEVAEARAAAAEELERKNQDLEAFSYSVSHDLRAPLRSIVGFSQALIEDFGAQLAPGARDYLDRVCAAARRMGELIDDLLALSGVSRTELRRESLDLSKLARAVAGEVERQVPERRMDFVIQDGLTAEADSRLIRVALENLLGNAWKFTAHVPKPRVEFGSEGEAPVFFVRDNGAGFDMARAEKLFTPFQRMHGAEFPGTGIGLTTVRRIIDRHGGQVVGGGRRGPGERSLTLRSISPMRSSAFCMRSPEPMVCFSQPSTAWFASLIAARTLRGSRSRVTDSWSAMRLPL